MSTKDQTHSARIHGEALLEARDLVGAGHRDIDPAMADVLQRLAGVTDDPAARADAAGRLAGQAHSLLEQPAVDRRQLAELFIAAGLAASSGLVDTDQLTASTRAAYAQATGSAVQPDD